MSSAALPQPRAASPLVSTLLRTWLLIGVADGLWAIVLTMAYGRPVSRLWQGVAATAFGDRMYDGGSTTVAVGLLMHFGVALGWSAVFVLLAMRMPWIRRVLDSHHGPLKIAAVYGPFIWIAMSAVVIPLLTHKPLAPTWRWWVQLAGHVVFVGLPIAWGTRRGLPSATRIR